MTWTRYLGGIALYVTAVTIGNHGLAASMIAALAVALGIAVHRVHTPGYSDPNEPTPL